MTSLEITLTREQVASLLEALLSRDQLDYHRPERIALCRLALKSFDQPAPPADVVEYVAKYLEDNTDMENDPSEVIARAAIAALQKLGWKETK